MTESLPTTHKVTYVDVDALYQGQRLDNYLIARLKGVPKSRIYRILRRGEVRINGGRIKPAYRLQTGDKIRIPPIRTSSPDTRGDAPAFLKQKLLASVLYEDQNLLVVNKPAGIAVHGGSGISHGVIETLRQARSEQPYLELAHRLDRDTSGCLILAKKPAELRRIHALLRNDGLRNDGLRNDGLRNDGLRKDYTLLVSGRWPNRKQEVAAPLKKNQNQSGERFTKVDPLGKSALTLFTVERRLAGQTLLRARLITGRTHQIRVHAQFAGYPVAGDSKYGNLEENSLLKKKHKLSRLFLHASRLLISGVKGADLVIEAPLPDDLEQVLISLEQGADPLQAKA